MDLEVIFNDVADYANDIEPSAVGGMKMAKIIKEIVEIHDFSIDQTKAILRKKMEQKQISIVK